MINICEDINNEQLRLFGLAAAGSKLIMYNDITVGMVDYNIYDEKVHIQYIMIQDEYRRLGIARKVIEKLMRENPGKYMYGDALPGAVKFWEKLGAEFEEDPDDDYLTPFIIEY
jgi:ribosomal protein S18 acetylase RimI-like enzyme